MNSLFSEKVRPLGSNPNFELSDVRTYLEEDFEQLKSLYQTTSVTIERAFYYYKKMDKPYYTYYSIHYFEEMQIIKGEIHTDYFSGPRIFGNSRRWNISCY